MKTKKNPEMPKVPKAHLKTVEHQRDQYKAENEKLRERNKELEKRCNQKLRRYVRGGLQQMKIADLESKYNDIKTERDTLIDDIAVLKANISRLERENEKLLNNYNSLTQHIRQKAEANPGVSRYIDLVNYIDRLERD